MPKPDDPGRSQSDTFAASTDTASGVPESGVGAQRGSGDEGLSHAALQPPPASFEDALAELEAIVGHMESGELTLEQSLSAYKRGAALLQYCQAALNHAQQQVKILEAGVLKDFSGAGENGQ